MVSLTNAICATLGLINLFLPFSYKEESPENQIVLWVEIIIYGIAGVIQI
jgi:hypothetical protein